MLGWLTFIIPTTIIVVYITLNVILNISRTNYLANDKKFRNNEFMTWKQCKKYKIIRFLHNHELNVSNAVVVSVPILAILCIVFFSTYTKTLSFVKKYETVSIEYTERSENFTNLERAAIFNSAADLTAAASVFRYWNKYFDPYITDDIENLKPIR